MTINVTVIPQEDKLTLKRDEYGRWVLDIEPTFTISDLPVATLMADTAVF